MIFVFVVVVVSISIVMVGFEFELGVICFVCLLDCARGIGWDLCLISLL